MKLRWNRDEEVTGEQSALKSSGLICVDSIQERLHPVSAYVDVGLMSAHDCITDRSTSSSKVTRGDVKRHIKKIVFIGSGTTHMTSHLKVNHLRYTLEVHTEINDPSFG